ncbi:MAG: hypothetical protein D6701_14390 [Gemmatimonadetes bacterium]|nr:MAG: hypothetical protein D6701_14390 [Gemmatimonadota bacterium]
MLTPTRTRNGASPEGTRRASLELLRHYAELVAEQERALDAGDFARFDALARSRAEIQRRLEDDDDRRHEETGLADRDREAAIEALRAAVLADQRIRARLSALRSETLGAIRSLGGRSDDLRRYLERTADAGREPRSRVDVRL